MRQYLLNVIHVSITLKSFNLKIFNRNVVLFKRKSTMAHIYNSEILLIAFLRLNINNQ